MAKISELTLSDLKQIQKLLAQKEKLQGQITTINQKLEQFETGRKSSPRRRTKTKAKKKKTSSKPTGQRRGQLKARIVKVVQSAGASGIHVKDIAKKVKNKEANVRTWFFTTGKKIKNIKSAGRAKYRWE